MNFELFNKNVHNFWKKDYKNLLSCAGTSLMTSYHQEHVKFPVTSLSSKFLNVTNGTFSRN
jgi:hypothetical protein